MAEYPPTPPFGMAPSRAAPPYRETSHHDMYNYGDSEQLGHTTLLEYRKAQTRAAFEQNTQVADFSGGFMTSGMSPLPVYRDQESPAYGYPNLSYGRDGSLEPPQSQNLYNMPMNSSPHKLPKSTPSALNHKHSLSQATAAPNTEEGEISEGEFEEERPNVSRNPKGVARRQGYYGRQTEDQRRPLYHGTYSGDGEHAVIPDPPLTDIYGRSLDLSRPRSKSYSPYEPPNEVEYEPHLSQEFIPSRRQLSYAEEYEPPEPRPQRFRQNEYGIDSLQVEGSHLSRHGFWEKTSTTAHPDKESTADVLGHNATTKSLHEARREAQNAILNLLPLKVRYHDYVDEGIDEEIVRRQFESLRVPLVPTDMQSIKHYGDNMTENLSNQSHLVARRNIEQSETFTSSSPQAPHVNQHHIHRDVSMHDNFNFPGNVSSHITPSDGNDRTVDNDSFVESRKDRIARLLSEKKKKQPSPVVQSDSPMHTASPENLALNKAITNSQSTAKADKERLLRQKMEALQKSREQRAQKNAAKTATTTTNTVTIDTLEDKLEKPTNQRISADQYTEPTLPNSTSPISTISKQAMPSIPGLFLASGTNTPANLANDAITSNNALNVMQRRRPVASDFDESSSIARPHKRPFGQNRMDHPLVIDVSDEESEEANDSEMELDQPQTIISDNSALAGASIAKTRAIRDLPPLSDFPPRKPFPPSSSAMSTPSAPQPSRTSINKPEDLQRKELEIQEMRRKIAEAERRKRAKQNSSGSQTPRPNDVTSSPAKNNGESIADKIETSAQIEHLIDDASRQVAQDQQKLVKAHAEERATEDELKKSESERRRLRRAEIASNLPVVDAEVEKAQMQLADLRAEMTRIEAAVQKGLEDKRRLAEEMDKLGQEADEQLQAHRDKLDELRNEEAKENGVSEPANQANIIDGTNSSAKCEESTDACMSDALPISNTRFQQRDNSDTGNAEPELQAPLSRAQSELQTEVIQREPLSHSKSESVSSDTQHEKSGQSLMELTAGDDHTEPSIDMTPDQSLEAALQRATAQAEVQFETDSINNIEVTDPFAPNPNILRPTSTSNSMEEIQRDDSNKQSSEDPMDVEGGESDQYEPPEATPQPADAFLPPGSPPFSPAPPIAESNNLNTDELYDHISLGPGALIASKTTRLVNDGILPPVHANENRSGQASRRTFFTPYESPLKTFKAFRFHPTFQQEVHGGFKSITYSNSIKDDKELCRYELAGGVCNDASCEFQHFRDMGLADDAILVELGNSAGYSEEDKPRFVAGLRNVLNGLRAKKTKDFHVIASEIAAYRARFLGDKSSILLLEESTT